MKLFDVSAQLDERFGKEGTASRVEAKENALVFFAGQIVTDARKKANITHDTFKEINMKIFDKIYIQYFQIYVLSFVFIL